MGHDDLLLTDETDIGAVLVDTKSGQLASQDSVVHVFPIGTNQIESANKSCREKRKPMQCSDMYCYIFVSIEDK